ncbi:MAG: DUF1501 domain-containing protein [Planctomycetaceae bacterium]|jgi:hypothetical protein|nr:DUF1501 domain-containing protein [Planctomycetaceae bacterium]
MINLQAQSSGDCRSGNRRGFLLQVGALGGLGLTLDQLLRSRQAMADAPTKSRDVNCILIWTRGGTSHHDTLDPKPEARAEIRGEFGTVDTAIPGVRFSDQVPGFARRANLFSVVRNLNSVNGAHGAADAIMLSGWPLNPAVTYPSYGSVVSRVRGKRRDMPAFVQLGNEVDRKFLGGTAGYLGITHNPFEVFEDPNAEKFTVRDLSLPGGVSPKRVSLRREALARIDRLQRGLDRRPSTLAAIDTYYDDAFRMITSVNTQRAFQLESESSKIRDAYGRTTFGQSCLLARRLIEAGSRFVTVSNGGWDTHSKNFSQLKTLLPPLDQALPMLVADLKQRGLLDSTLVVWLTDFGRTPKVNTASGRDHWASAGLACFAGAGTPPGTIVGQTDAEGGRAVGEEYYPKDIAATIYSRLGIPLDTTHVISDGRPMRLCEGRPIRELS